MKRESVRKAVDALQAEPKRGFSQSVDLIINLRDLNLKDPKQQIDQFIRLPKGRGRKAKVCALIGPELHADAKQIFEKVILQEQFPGFAEKKLLRKLAKDFDYFVAQANIMASVATTFGRVLGTRGKMPNPKAGCVVPPKGANLRLLHENLSDTIRVAAKKDPLLQCVIGSEQMSAEDLTENAMSVLSSVLRVLPNEEHNIRSVYLKKTMSKPVQVS